VKNLAMSAAHGAKAMAVCEETRESGIDRALVVAFVFDDFLADDAIGLDDALYGRPGCSIVQRIRDLAQAVEARRKSLVILVQKSRGLRRHGAPARRLAWSVSARNAFRITATSMASWVSAPATGVSQPKAAAPMATPESDIPTTMLCRAMARVR
jgi:hypothetical protein